MINGGGKHGVGIVLSPETKLACIDIDHAWDGSAWSPLALELYNTFAGCYFEVSQSGRGMHLIFSYTGEFPAHDCKNIPLHIELYHELRFIFLTGTQASGSALKDCTDAAAATIAKYFAPVIASSIVDAKWTDEPIWKSAPGVREPNDSVLVKDFRECRSASAHFGNGTNASNEAVWAGITDELARHFPSETGSGYDASSVDESLATRLMWWTGGDCERVLRLMHESKLVRDKWKREDYLPRTILKALKFVSASPPTRRSAVRAVEIC
ncbi:MAG: hypothetical protein ACLPTF_19610 [Steroidobacteraceae bacterium]